MKIRTRVRSKGTQVVYEGTRGVSYRTAIRDKLLKQVISDTVTLEYQMLAVDTLTGTTITSFNFTSQRVQWKLSR